MADNATLPATGAVIAADEIGGALVQRIKPQHGVDGEAVDTSTTNPLPVQLLGEAIEALEAMRVALGTLTRTLAASLPDVSGRARVAVESLSSGMTLATVTTVGTVTTAATLTNQTNIGGNPATVVIPSFLGIAASAHRDRIQVS